jgi:hypothetical protein
MEKKLICLLLEVYNNQENYEIDSDAADTIFQTFKKLVPFMEAQVGSVGLSKILNQINNK